MNVHLNTHWPKDALIGGPFVFKIRSHYYFTFNHQNVNSKCNNDDRGQENCVSGRFFEK